MKTQDLFFLLILIASLVIIGIMFPWWVQMVWTGIVFFIWKPGVRLSLLFGGIGVSSVWLIISIYLLLNDSAGIIQKTGQLMGGISPALMVLLAFITGWISGMLSAWLGNNVGVIFRSELPKTK